MVAPLARKAGWAAVKDFAHSLAESMSADAPEKYLSTATKAKRGGHIYIDYLRNGRGNTAVAAYSTRARPGAPVSMPIDWTELNEVSGPAAFTLANVPQRLATRPSDPWRDFFDAAAPLE